MSQDVMCKYTHIASGLQIRIHTREDKMPINKRLKRFRARVWDVLVHYGD